MHQGTQRNVSTRDGFCNSSFFCQHSSLRARCITCMLLFRGNYDTAVSMKQRHITQRAASSWSAASRFPSLEPLQKRSAPFRRAAGAHGEATQYSTIIISSTYRLDSAHSALGRNWPLRSQIPVAHQASLPTKRDPYLMSHRISHSHPRFASNQCRVS